MQLSCLAILKYQNFEIYFHQCSIDNGYILTVHFVSSDFHRTADVYLSPYTLIHISQKIDTFSLCCCELIWFFLWKTCICLWLRAHLHFIHINKWLYLLCFAHSEFLSVTLPFMVYEANLSFEAFTELLCGNTWIIGCTIIVINTRWLFRPDSRLQVICKTDKFMD